MIRLRELSLDVKGEFLFSVDSFDFERGKKYLLVGDNGSGKSSLMKSMISHFDFFTGRIEVEGQIIYQPQDPYLFQRTVRDNLRLSGMDEELMKGELGRLFAEDILDKRVRVLSGGQRQKTALLRSLYKARDILLLDEPFSQMDEKSSLEAQAMVEDWHRKDEDRILVMISHDMELRAMEFDTKIHLCNQSFNVEKLR